MAEGKSRGWSSEILLKSVVISASSSGSEVPDDMFTFNLGMLCLLNATTMIHSDPRSDCC